MSDWVGVDAFFARLNRIEDNAGLVTKELVTVASALLVRESQANFVGAHSRGRPHVGGNQPNVVSGDARRSIRADFITKFGPTDYGTTVGPRVIYSRRLELGWKGSRGYPFFQPAAVKLQPEFARTAAELWEKRMGRL